MADLADLAPYQSDLIAIRRDLHAHPELGLEVPRTAGIVAGLLRAWGFDVADGVGGYGVVATLQGAAGSDGPVIGLRADMDALPILEAGDLPWKSLVPGRMHACGHDGHTTMLLGAARHLAATHRFGGTLRLIFQPGEEGAGGALAMLEDGLFERFPCDAIYGLHNRPGFPLGNFAIRPGPFLAGGAFFDIRVLGVGAHGGRPETGVDAIVVAAQLVSALQSVVSRSLSPWDPTVLSITRIAGGGSYNVIPGEVHLAGTARALDTATLLRMETLVRRAADGVTAAAGATAEVDWRLIFAPVINDPVHTMAMAAAAASLVGDDRVLRREQAIMISEDFSFMLEQVPGAYIQMGIGDTAGLHNAAYAFNDDAIPYGAAFFATLVERGAPVA